MGHTRGEGAGGGHRRPPERGKFSKRRSKTGHSQQIVKEGGVHWISSLCTTILKFEHKSAI